MLLTTMIMYHVAAQKRARGHQGVMRKHKSNNPLHMNATSVQSQESGFTRVLMLLFAVGMAMLAITANRNSKAHSPMLMGIIALLFSEIYFIQAGLRFANGSYKVGVKGY